MAEDKKEEKKEAKQEEKVIKVNLKVLLMIIALVVMIIILFAGIYIKENKDIVDSEGNNFSISKIVSGNKEFNENNGIDILRAYLNEKSIAMSSPQALLEKYGFATNKQFASYEKTADATFIKTDILYENIRTTMQKYITKELFTKEFKTIYKQSNGVTHVANLNNPKQTYTITRHEMLENKNKPLVQVWYTTTQDGKTSEEKSMKVEFVQYNGNWIISNIS